MKIHSFNFNCSKNRLKDIRCFVDQALQSYSFTDIEKHKMVLAVDEICANLIIHSHECNPAQNVRLEIKENGNDGIIFEITDKGKTFNVKNYREPKINEIVKAGKKGGVGLLLVKRIMDNVEWSTENDRNICRLYKKIG
ncbi:MAG: ATP-binding protein [Cyclobacteriaceae bacterium]|nr:ATP-binding protein [Cyclobacteriaceae bacterium]MCH8516530.1 ATP-binding protein [Cyclobacteriaceae bacterium]